MQTRIKELMAKLKAQAGGRQAYYVTGSGLVNVPTDRMTEIPRIIAEHHALEAERAKQLAAAQIRQVR
jgi:hypothetical protein